jgi:phosphoserine phosphatase RsbU/P
MPGEQQSTSQTSLHEENTRLQRAVFELSVLNDLALAIGGQKSSTEIMQTIIHRSLKAVGAEQGVITFVEDPDALGMHTLVRTMETKHVGAHYHLDQQLLGWMHLHKQALSIDSPGTDERFQGVHWDPSVYSVLCVPLIVKAALRGVLTVYNKANGSRFTSEDQRLLAIIAAQSAQLLENARLLESEKQLQLMQEDLRVAARIQHNLLPQSPPAIPNYEITGITLPAKVVGGDYFDYFPVGESRIGLALGDVSGKGLPASLLMANVQATLRGQAFWAGSPAECISRANQQLYLSTESDRFVTLFFALLDLREHRLTYCNAGQEPPLLMSADGSCQRLTTGGLLLGVSETARYEEATVCLQPNDVLLAYSDGFSEAIDPGGVMFGEKGVLEVLQNRRATEVSQVVKALLDATALHAGAAPQNDDRTVLALRRREA